MEIEKLNVGFALTGSFCTLASAVEQMEGFVKAGANVIPIMSEIVYTTDTRFGRASYFIDIVEGITGNTIIHTIQDAEPIGPKKLLDLLVIAPCTGNTLAKLATGVNDSAVTMAAKAHIRNQRPVVVAVSTNDGLGNSAKNIGVLLNTNYIYMVPFRQDDYVKKPNSLVADMRQLLPAAQLALEGQQIQPVLV